MLDKYYDVFMSEELKRSQNNNYMCNTTKQD